MRDLTPVFKVAIAHNILWKVSGFYAVIDLLKQQGFEISHWDGEENWAMAVYKNQIVGYLWHQHPLIFIESNYLNQLQATLTLVPYLSVVETPNLNDVLFRLDYKGLSGYLEYGVNYEGFSAEELWFFTNSI